MTTRSSWLYVPEYPRGAYSPMTLNCCVLMSTFWPIGLTVGKSSLATVWPRMTTGCAALIATGPNDSPWLTV